MAFNLEDIKSSKLCQWDGDDFYVLAYRPKKSGKANETTRFILSFKENDNEAVNLATTILISLFKRIGQTLRDERQCRYIVSIPSSTAGRDNVPAERVCMALAKSFNWLTHLPEALKRTKNVQKSAWAPPGGRPNYDTHLRTIQYAGPRLRPGDDTIIMLDDVITRKATSCACRDILIKATASKRVTGIYLGRTVWS